MSMAFLRGWTEYEEEFCGTTRKFHLDCGHGARKNTNKGLNMATNSERAERLAKAGFLYQHTNPTRPPTYSIPGKTWIDSADGMMAEGELLLWLLRTIPSRGYEVELDSIEDGGWFMTLYRFDDEKYFNAKNDDPLLAIVDAFLASQEAGA